MRRLGVRDGLRVREAAVRRDHEGPRVPPRRRRRRLDGHPLDNARPVRSRSRAACPISLSTVRHDLRSIYICFGGVGDFRTSGTSTALSLDRAQRHPERHGAPRRRAHAVQYDDRHEPRVRGRRHRGVGDRRRRSDWNPLQNGLPDAPGPTSRSIRRPGSCGRPSMVEARSSGSSTLRRWPMSSSTSATDAGTGRGSTPTAAGSLGASGPRWPTTSVRTSRSTCPRLRATRRPPRRSTSSRSTKCRGRQRGVATNVPPPTVHNRVYVEVHNRGRFEAVNVRVMAAITNAATGLISGRLQGSGGQRAPRSAEWITLGVTQIPRSRPASRGSLVRPPVDPLPMPASLPGNSHYCVVVFVHSSRTPSPAQSATSTY